MKWKQHGRAAALALATMAMAAGMVSCTNTKLGYVFALSQGTNGTTNGQIYAYRVDANAGTLSLLGNKSSTQTNSTGSGGYAPTRLVLAGGGEFVYVLNVGVGGAQSNITEFTVGSDGSLFAQQTYFSQGNNPQDITLSGDGGYLYVADQTNPYPTTCPESLPACGDITVFSIDASTGNLHLVQNSQVLDPSGNALGYFPVGVNPVRVLSANGYVYTLDNTYVQTGSLNSQAEIYVYQQSTASSTPGQLLLTQNTKPTFPVGMLNPTSFTATGTTMYVADAGTCTATSSTATQNCVVPSVFQFSLANVVPQPISGAPNNPIQLTTGNGTTNNGSLTGPVTSPPIPEDYTGPTLPSDIKIDPTGKYVFVAASGTNQLVGFNIATSSSPGSLSFYGTAGGGSSASSGSNPRCIAITGGREFLYTANFDDGSVSGIQVDATTGLLKNNTNSVKTAGQASCLVYSSRTD